MNRVDYLHEAEKQITGKRENDHGRAESNFQTISDYWSIYTGIPFTAHDVAVMMALLKIARIQNGGGSGDSYVDLCGYGALAGELRSWKPQFKDEPVTPEELDNAIQSVSENMKITGLWKDVESVAEYVKEKYGDMNTPEKDNAI